MSTDLHAIEEALAGLTDVELYALKGCEQGKCRKSRLACLHGSRAPADWELNRRSGLSPSGPSEAMSARLGRTLRARSFNLSNDEEYCGGAAHDDFPVL
jgi:hypothetical protein